MDYTVFSSMFAVSTPYNGTDAYYYSTSPSSPTLIFTTIDIVFLFFASLLGFTIIFWTIYLVCCKSRRQQGANALEQQAPVPVTAPVSYVRTGTQPHHVNAYYVADPTEIIGPPLIAMPHLHETLSGVNPTRTHIRSHTAPPVIGNVGHTGE